MSNPRHIAARQEWVNRLGPQLPSLRALSPGRRIIDLLFFAGLLAFAWSCPLRPVSFLCAVVALNAFVLLVHEGMHGLLFGDARLNRWTSVALGGFVLISHSAYKVMHGRHHRYLGDPRDPDDYDNYIRDRRLVWVMHYVRLAAGSFLYLALIPTLSLRHGKAEERRGVAQEYLILASCYGSLYALGNHAWLLEHWLLPLIAVGFFTNLRGLTQHGISDADDPYLASRSIHTHPFLAFLLLHENYHLEHHLFPEVPSYNLPRLHSLIYPQLREAVVNRGYLEFFHLFMKATPTLDRTPIGLVRKDPK